MSTDAPTPHASMTRRDADVARARQLLKLAAKAVDAFEDAIRELVALRAWELLGYESLAVMWEAENGFKCPTYAKVLAVEAMHAEGMNTVNSMRMRKYGTNGHTRPGIGKAVGLPVRARTKKNRTFDESPIVGEVLKQLGHGVPADKVSLSLSSRTIDKYGTRARSHPRRIGKSPGELVPEGFNLTRRDADAVAEIARKADVPKSEIYRQAVAEYLARHAASREHPA